MKVFLGSHQRWLCFLSALITSVCLQCAAATDTIWLDDAIPAGAWTGAEGGDSWSWVGANPPPYSGALAHQANLAPGVHYHYFSEASGTLPVQPGDSLFAYVFLDPANPPRELMVSWFDGASWAHVAYWGENLIPWGDDGTASQYPMGALPANGAWIRLEVPARAVGLEGRTLSGMGFVLYDGRATWDNAGKSGNDNSGGTGTNAPSPSIVDYANLQIPAPGDHTLHVLAPTLLELVLINTKQPNPARVDSWDWVDDQGNFLPPNPARIKAVVNGQTNNVTGVGFKRRPLSAPLANYDLRIASCLYLQLNTSIADGQSIQVINDGTLWPTNMEFAVTAAPLRYSPAIHVNQEGYVPSFPKHAIVGYYLGNLGEMTISSTNFSLADARSGATVFSGTLKLRGDVGYTYTPPPYQNVYEADFSSFTTPGEYHLVVPGLGASLPFLIDDGIAMNFARTYALGLFHQRSGYNVAMPFTRFTHAADHTAPAGVPTNASAPFVFTWTTVSNYAVQVNSDNPPQTAPLLTRPSAQRYPFVNRGPIDVSGGHFEAGDYNRYTCNSAQVVHCLMFAADSLPGVATLDNLGIPESGDGVSDALQEAKWEADFLAKLQDADGGFYYVVNPLNREYEFDVLPENGDPLVVWPKNTAVTAAAVAALAECASSPRFKQAYPQVANNYLAKAQLGWQFLTNAIARFGQNGAYQKIDHFGDDFTDRDELAWAACEMFLATGDPQYQATLQSWFPDPADYSTFKWGWWRMYACYGNAVRSYAFAARSGRLAASQLDSNYLARCIITITNCGNDNLSWSQDNAYGSSFPDLTKTYHGGGWYFSPEQAFDIVVAYQFSPDPAYLDAILRNLNYEGGCNPVNVAYVTGLGWKRQREVVDQYSANDRHRLPKDGVPIGNIQPGFFNTWTYGYELSPLTYPSDNAGTAPYPFYDRWGDTWNVSTEASTTDTVRSFASAAWLAAQTATASKPWRSTNAVIIVPTNTILPGQPVTVSLRVADTNLSKARIVWEARDQEPSFGGLDYTFTPVQYDGPHWIEAEVQWPDGRRAFATNSITVGAGPNRVWFDDVLPAGAAGYADGGDSWNWIGGNPPPFSGARAHQSANVNGVHYHAFIGASDTLLVNPGDTLTTYVYLDASNPPREIMLSWYDGQSWDHRAYWGENLLPYGTDGTASQMHMGALPPAGQWFRLEVPASAVGLEGGTISGMGFVLSNGRATWDHSGKSGQ